MPVKRPSFVCSVQWLKVDGMPVLGLNNNFFRKKVTLNNNFLNKNNYFSTGKIKIFTYAISVLLNDNA